MAWVLTSRYAESCKARALNTSLSVGLSWRISPTVFDSWHLRKQLHFSCCGCDGGALRKRCARCGARQGRSQATLQLDTPDRQREAVWTDLNKGAVGVATAGAEHADETAVVRATTYSGTLLDRTRTKTVTVRSRHPSSHASASGSTDLADARQITRLISEARTWSELAAVVRQNNAIADLNEIHLAAAICRLAKLDLGSAAVQRRGSHDHDPQQQPRPHPAAPYQPQSAPPLSAGAAGPRRATMPLSPLPSARLADVGNPTVTSLTGYMPYPDSVPCPGDTDRQLPPPPPPPPSARAPIPGMTLHGRGPAPPPTVQLSTRGPSSPQLGPGAHVRATSGATDGALAHAKIPGAETAVAATAAAAAEAARIPVDSAWELCVELLEALARRCGDEPAGATVGMPNAPVTGADGTIGVVPAGFDAPGDVGRSRTGSLKNSRSAGAAVGDSCKLGAATATVRRPPPARVLANATWGGTRLLMQIFKPATSGRPSSPRAVQSSGSNTEPAGRQQYGYSADASPHSSQVAWSGPADTAVAGKPARDLRVAPGVILRSDTVSPRAQSQQALPEQHQKLEQQLLALRLRAATAMRALLSRVPEAAPSLEPQHVSNLLYSVARLAQQLPELLEDELPTAGAAGKGGGAGLGAASVVSASAVPAGVAGTPQQSYPRVSELTRRLVDSLLDASLPKLGSFGPQALSNSLYAVALLGISPPGPWMHAWQAAAAAGQLYRADPQHIANMLWSLARLGCHPGDPWVVTALQSAAMKAPAFTTQGLCNTLWALARLGFTPGDAASSRLLLPLVAGLGTAARECGGQDVANGMWALARLYMALPPLPPSSATSHPALPSGPNRALNAEPAIGFAEPAGPTSAHAATAAMPQQQQPASVPALREALRGAGRRLLSASSRHLHAFSPQQVANTAWAAAALGLAPLSPDWVAQFWHTTQAALPHMRTEELVATAMSSARLQLQPPNPWLVALLELTNAAALQRQQRHRTVRDGASPPPASGGDTAFEADAAIAETSLPRRNAVRFQPTGRALASLLWCVQAWEVRVPVGWTMGVLRQFEMLAAVGQLEPVSLAAALHAMARMKLRPDSVIAGWTSRVVGDCLGSSGMGVGLHAGNRGPSPGGDGGGGVDAAGRDAGALRSAVWEESARGSPGQGGVVEGGGASTAVDVGTFDARSARMVLWSLARLQVRVPDQVAGALAIRALDGTALPAAAGQELTAELAAPRGAGRTTNAAAASRQAAGPTTGMRVRRLFVAGMDRAAPSDAAVDPDDLGAAEVVGASGGGGDGNPFDDATGMRFDRADAGGQQCQREGRDLDKEVERRQRRARDVCVALWALARMSCRPSAVVMRQLVRRVTEDVPWATESQLQAIVRSFAALGFRPGDSCRRAIEERLARLGPAVDGDKAAELMSLCSRLRWRLSEGTLRALREE